jgi:E3 ubiquitin-protein ligase HECTD2
MLRPEEVEQLVCGCPTIDLTELRKVTYYDGFKQDDVTIQHFWEVLIKAFVNLPKNGQIYYE